MFAGGLRQRSIERVLEKEQGSPHQICSPVITDKSFDVTGLKAQLALPCVFFIKHCQFRLIDIIKGQVNLIYKATALWSKSSKV